jgi:hypothetical protein
MSATLIKLVSSLANQPRMPLSNRRSKPVSFVCQDRPPQDQLKLELSDSLYRLVSGICSLFSHGDYVIENLTIKDHKVFIQFSSPSEKPSCSNGRCFTTGSICVMNLSDGRIVERESLVYRIEPVS